MIELINEVDSTNRYLADELKKRQLPSGFTICAEQQTHGRGQAGNSWESEPYQNLLFSVYLHPADVPANRSFVISEMASLCVKYTLDNYIPDVYVKWPNDVYYRDKKIAGILIENVLMDGKTEQSIIGIGININQRKFVSDAPNPVSLSQITGIHYERTDVLSAFRKIFKEQSKRLNDNRFDEIHKDYLDAIYRRDGHHNFSDSDGIFEAAIHDVEPTGYLVLKRTDGCLSKYAFKEVVFL